MPNKKLKMGKREERARYHYRNEISQYRRRKLPPIEKTTGDTFVMRTLSRLEEKGFTQAHLAKEAGLTPQAVNRILSMKPEYRPKQLNIDRVRLFAAILDCTPHYLLGFSDDPSTTSSGSMHPISYLSSIPIHFAECIEKATHEEFVKCICEIVYKDTPENKLMDRTAALLKIIGFCDPDTFDFDQCTIHR